MKIQNIMRMTAATIGFAAALFLASSTPAQEITNTEWPDRPGATEPLQAAPAASAADSAAAKQVAESTVAASTPMAAQEDAVTQLPMRGLSIGLLLLSIAGVALYARSEAKETERKIDARFARTGRSVSLS
jgi:hypothetical protein